MESRQKPLDLLRGVAIVSVMVFHCAIFFQPHVGVMKWVQYGAHGVQLFFVVSAITMCMMWEARQDESHRVLKFYIRRFFRIAPLFWLAAIIWSIFSVCYGPGFAGWWSLASTVTFLHGFSAETYKAVVPGGWSIAVEMSFYLAFPFLACLRRSPWRVFLVLLSSYFFFNVLLTSAYVQARQSAWSERDVEFLYQSVLTQVPVFLFGFIVWQRSYAGVKLKSVGVAIALFCAFSFVLKGAGYHYARPFFWLVCAAISLGASFAIEKTLSCFPLEWLGRLSYSLYLTHFAVLDWANFMAPDWSRGGWVSLGFWTLFVISASSFVSWVSSRTFERWSAQFASALVRKID